jgi:hypothetical protein
MTEADAHDILRNDRRRAVIEQLRQTVGESDLRTLAEAIAENETGESPPPRNIRESVYNSLHQTHLPKLDQLGIVDYDQNRKTVALQRDAREVDPYMDVYLNEVYSITWAEYYRTVAVVGFVTVLAAELGVPVLAQADIVLLISLCLTVIAVSTVYQLWGQRWVFFNRLLGLEEEN